jgi:cysteine desulfurase
MELCFFCDATQSVGKIEVDVKELNVDMLSFSAHKFHGPKGVGALFLSDSIKNRIQAQQTGGSQEFGLRSGTPNSAGIIGFGEACRIALTEREESKVEKLRDMLETSLLKIPGTFINGNKEKRIYSTSNLCFPGNDANVIIGRLKNIAISNGSACTSSIVEPSHVLSAMGLDDELSLASLRFSLSKYNSENEIKVVIEEMSKVLVPSLISK